MQCRSDVVSVKTTGSVNIIELWNPGRHQQYFQNGPTEQELNFALQEILTARINEKLAKAVRCYPALYDKSMKEFKDQKKCLLRQFSLGLMSLL